MCESKCRAGWYIANSGRGIGEASSWTGPAIYRADGHTFDFVVAIAVRLLPDLDAGTAVGGGGAVLDRDTTSRIELNCPDDYQ